MTRWRDDLEPSRRAALDRQVLDDLDDMTTVDEMCRHSAAVCTDAAHAASVCATAGWANEHLSPDGTSEVTRWCLASSRVLGTCADILGEQSQQARIHLVMAQARAGLVAAQECAAACSVDADIDPLQADCAAACRRASDALRGLLAALTPAAGDPANRASAT